MLNPTARALIRDLLAGLGAFLASYQAGEEWTQALIAGAVVFVGLAAAEFGTPLNPSVGVGSGVGK